MTTFYRDSIIYFYRNEELMLRAITERGYYTPLQNADYAVRLDPSSEYDYCTMIKDRSGFFNISNSLPLKKAVKIIKILMEE